MNKAHYILVFLIFCSVVQAGPRKIKKPFETDICTSWFDGTKAYNWSHCCIMHDLRLWAGGLKSHRNNADKELKICVHEAANAFYANLMYFGVRIGSMSPYKLEGKGWGNAWSREQVYKKVSKEEIAILRKHLWDSKVPELKDVSIEEFIDGLYLLNGF